MNQKALADANKQFAEVAPSNVWELRNEAIESCLKIVNHLARSFTGEDNQEAVENLNRYEAFVDAGLHALRSAAIGYTNPKIKFCTYAWQAVKRRMIDAKRREKRQKRLKFCPLNDDVEQKSGIDDQTVVAIWNAVDNSGLDKLEKEILMAFVYNEKTYTEVMGGHINPNTGRVYTRANAKHVLRRALDKCREAILLAA